MWLLSTDRAELHFFSSPETVTGGYAILSHTWGNAGDEQTFQETQALRERCKKSEENPRDLSTSKVRESCLLAERQDYRWIWNDTCCIDKTSSTELLEAINSMFLWYSRAEVCYVYMQDVESDCAGDVPGSAFRQARWHLRGWTLQELIAPSFVIFMSQDWKPLGHKVALAPLLQEITGIPSQVLTGQTHFSILSIAERMSWASTRNTTRVEDEAYCLMGLFNVNMPTIYGEGRQAFRRLQHEIMKHSFDISLFAWDRFPPSRDLKPLQLHQMYQFFHTPSARENVYLLSPSPKNFIKPSNRPAVQYTPSALHPLQPYLDWQGEKPGGFDPKSILRKYFGPFGRRELPHVSITSFGFQCRFPIIKSGGLIVAVLLCDNHREHVGLLLHPSHDPIQDPSRKRHRSGYCFWTPSGGVAFARLVSLGNDLHNLRLNGKKVTAKWCDILIAEAPPPFTNDIVPLLLHPLNLIVPAPPFYIPHWLVWRLMQMGMDPVLPLLMTVDNPGEPLNVTVAFSSSEMNAPESVHLNLGICMRYPGRPSHWARASAGAHLRHDSTHGHNVPVDAYEAHSCLEHHIDAWPGWAKDFGDTARMIRLSFSRCRATPAHTLVVQIDLVGHVYSAMKDRSRVVFPLHQEIGLRENVVGPRRDSAALALPSSEPQFDFSGLSSAITTPTVTQPFNTLPQSDFLYIEIPA